MYGGLVDIRGGIYGGLVGGVGGTGGLEVC